MNQVEEITQLNEEKIIINTPLRVKASIPLRNIKSFTSDDDMRQKVFSPAGFTLMNTLLSALTDMNIANQNEVLMLRELLSDHDVESNYKYLDGTVLKDCKLLASSSKRSGKKDVEASATLSIAILNDNQSKFAQVFIIIMILVINDMYYISYFSNYCRRLMLTKHTWHCARR